MRDDDDDDGPYDDGDPRGPAMATVWLVGTLFVVGHWLSDVLLGKNGTAGLAIGVVGQCVNAALVRRWSGRFPWQWLRARDEQ